MLEQTPIRDSFLPHLSRGDLQNIGQTNSANMASVYRAGSSTAPVPLELPFRGTSGWVNGQIQEFGYPIIANPHYVNEVRQTISGTHPRYYPWQIGEAGIQNTRQLRIIDRGVFETYHLDGGIPSVSTPHYVPAAYMKADYQWLSRHPRSMTTRILDLWHMWQYIYR